MTTYVNQKMFVLKISAARRVHIKLGNVFKSCFKIVADHKQLILKARPEISRNQWEILLPFDQYSLSSPNSFHMLCLKPERLFSTMHFYVKPCTMESQCRRQKEDSACRIFKEISEHALQKSSQPVCLVLG